MTANTSASSLSSPHRSEMSSGEDEYPTEGGEVAAEEQLAEQEEKKPVRKETAEEFEKEYKTLRARVVQEESVEAVTQLQEMVFEKDNYERFVRKGDRGEMQWWVDKLKDIFENGKPPSVMLFVEHFALNVVKQPSINLKKLFDMLLEEFFFYVVDVPKMGEYITMFYALVIKRHAKKMVDAVQWLSGVVDEFVEVEKRRKEDFPPPANMITKRFVKSFTEVCRDQADHPTLGDGDLTPDFWQKLAKAVDASKASKFV